MEETKLQKKKRKAQNENNKELLISASTDLADIYIKRGEYKLAIQEYNILAEIYETENKLEYGKVNRGIGEAYMGLHNFETALQFFKIYLDISIEQNDELEKQRAYATLGHANLTWYLETQSDPEKTLNNAFKYFMKSLLIAEKLSGISKLEKMDMTSRLFSNLGLVKECLGEYDKALELLNKSIAVCKQNDIYEQLCRGYLSIASLFEKKNDSNEAIQNLNFAIEAAKKLKSNVDLICTALQAKSEVLIKLADFNGAKQVLVKAYKLKTPNINDRKAIERNLRVVAQMCYTEDKLVVSSGDSLEMKKLYEIMGDGACELKNYSKAIEYYQLMLKFAEKSGMTNKELASCYYSLAETYKDNGQFEEAIEYFEKEYMLYEDLQDNLNTLSNIVDTKESANVSKDEIKKVYERAFKNCRDCKNLKEERRMVIRYITYLKRNNHNSDAFEMENYLGTLQDINFEDESSSEPESEETETRGMVGSELNLDEITDDTDDSELENRENVPQTIPSRKRSKAFTMKKNQRGETQLHVACINGKLPVVKHLLDQGHPVNVRDHTGWLPLHEACNHGHYEIVKVLLDNGAAINDRGGTLCNGVTPLYDAASNGHLKIVELLLDRGASAIIKTDDGDTSLNILKEWMKKNSPHGEDLYLCESLITRMTEILQRTGQKVVGSYSDNQNQKENKHIRKVENIENLKRKTGIRGRAILLDLDDGDENDGSIISADSTSEEYYEIDCVDEYQKTMDAFTRKSFSGDNRKKPNRKSVPALINSDEVMLDDWLDDDLLNKKTLKKQKLDPLASAGPSSSKSTSISPRLRNSFSPQKKSQASQRKISDDFIIPDHFFDNDFENDITMEPESPVRYQEKLNPSEEKSSRNSSIRKTQTSLLETGFSRHNSGNFTSQKNNDRISTRSPLKRNSRTDISKTKQPKMTSFVRNSSFTEPDSTTQIKQMELLQPTIPTKTACLGELMVYVDVKIEGMVFRIPVLLSQVQTKSLGWLAEQAAHKYARKEGTKPQLELETTSGALLSDEDPLSLLFPLGAVHAEQVIGKILKMSLAPLEERYREACVQMELDSNKELCSLLQEISIELNISNKWFQSTALVPLCKALNHQTSLFELNLSGNYLDMSCIKMITISFPTLCNLTTLNLKGTGLNAGHLAEIATIFTTSTTPVLQNLQYLDLSDNFLKDKSLRHLSFITKHLHLTSLNLSDVKFTSNIFFDANNTNSELNLKNIQIFDISDNSFECSDITKIMGWLDFKKIRRLNLARTVRKEEGILQNIINFLEAGFGRQLESLNLSRCLVQESELYEFLRLSADTCLSDLNLSYNSNLTGISLRRLLECSHLEVITLIGCDKILHYFSNCGENDYLLQDSNQQQRKFLKISGNFHQYEQQLQAVTEIFNNKYEKCYTERQDRLGVALFTISSKPLELS